MNGYELITILPEGCTIPYLAVRTAGGDWYVGEITFNHVALLMPAAPRRDDGTIPVHVHFVDRISLPYSEDTPICEPNRISPAGTDVTHEVLRQMLDTYWWMLVQPGVGSCGRVFIPREGATWRS